MTEEHHLSPSPRLATLRAALARGDEAALSRFWHELEEAGTPLIEAIPEDDGGAVVTFVYRAASDVRLVEVACPLAGRGRLNEPMTRLPGSDLWLKSYRVRRGLRTEYWFVPDGVPQPDPRNPRMLVFPPDEDAFWDKTVPESWFEVPPATPSWLDGHADPAGRVERVRLRSRVLGNERPITIYATPGYDAARDGAPLVLLFDRWVYAHVLPTFAMLDRLVAGGAIPPLLLVLVGHPHDGARHAELSCHAPFADFLARELLPWAAQQYGVRPHPATTAVGGMSAGGLAAADAGLRYPDLFGNILAQSGAFSWKPDEDLEYEWPARQFVASPRLPLRWYLSAGSLETRATDGARPSLLLANRHLRDVLRAKGYPVHYAEFDGGHDFVWQLPCLADGLRILLGAGGSAA